MQTTWAVEVRGFEPWIECLARTPADMELRASEMAPWGGPSKSTSRNFLRSFSTVGQDFTAKQRNAYDKPCERLTSKTPSMRDGVQRCETCANTHS